MQKGDFDFNDFLFQSQSVKKMGGMSSMVKLIPGNIHIHINIVVSIIKLVVVS